MRHAEWVLEGRGYTLSCVISSVTRWLSLAGSGSSEPSTSGAWPIRSRAPVGRHDYGLEGCLEAGKAPDVNRANSLNFKGFHPGQAFRDHTHLAGGEAAAEAAHIGARCVQLRASLNGRVKSESLGDPGRVSPRPNPFAKEVDVSNEQRTTREAPRYFLIEGPPDALVKIDDGAAYVWRDGAWEQDSWAARKISAYDGEVEARPIDAHEAHRFVQEETPGSMDSGLAPRPSPDLGVGADFQ